MDCCQIDDEEYLEIQQRILTPIKINMAVLEYSTTTFFDYLSFWIIKKRIDATYLKQNIFCNYLEIFMDVRA